MSTKSLDGELLTDEQYENEILSLSAKHGEGSSQRLSSFRQVGRQASDRLNSSGLEDEQYAEAILSIVNGRESFEDRVSSRRDVTSSGDLFTKKSAIAERASKPGAEWCENDSDIQKRSPESRRFFEKKSEFPAGASTSLDGNVAEPTQTARGDDTDDAHRRSTSSTSSYALMPGFQRSRRRMPSVLARPGAVAVPGPESGGLYGAEGRDAVTKSFVVRILMPRLRRQSQIPVTEGSGSHSDLRAEREKTQTDSGVDKEQTSRRRLFLLLLGVVLLLGAIGAGVGVATANNNSGSRGEGGVLRTAAPSFAPAPILDESACVSSHNSTSSQSDRFIALSLSLAVESQPNSPQRKALCWIADFDEFRGVGEGGMQRYVVALVFFSLVSEQNRKHFPSWVSNQSECNWEGVQCQDSRTVSGIILINRGLQGSVPSEIGSLDSLGECLDRQDKTGGPSDS